MKKIFFTLLLFPFFLLAQKIKKSEYDKFIKAYRIVTDDIAVKQGLGKGLALGFRSVDSTIFIVVSGYGRTTGVVGSDDKIIFLFSNDSTAEGSSKGIQSYNIGQYQNSFSHEYYIAKEEIVKLQSGTVKSLRIYNSDGYVDTDFKENISKLINKLAAVFLNEYQNKVLTKK